MAPLHPAGARLAALAAAVFVALWLLPATAQEIVHFRSADDNGPGQLATELEGRLFRPNGEGPFPALVGLHGCNGMMRPYTRSLTALYRAWGEELSRRGYVVLFVDSLGPRGHGEMCSIGGFDPILLLKRPHDAYGALLYLQQQTFVRGDRIGLVGWSQGGAVARGSAVDLVAYPGAYHGFDAPNSPRRELPDYKTRAGVVPIIGTDPAARADVLVRVPAFLDRYLKD